jgi:nitrite reductase/ring-hydroxylating ferredoxin subunit
MSELNCPNRRLTEVNEGKLSLSRRNFFAGIAIAAGSVGLTGIAESAQAATKKYKVCTTKDVKVGSAVLFLVKSANIMVLITQPKAGTFRAFNPACTHEGFQINGVQGKNLVCPVHQAQFDMSTGGVKRGPARKALRQYKLTKTGTTIYINA